MTACDPFIHTDDLGPTKVVHLTERSTGLRAIVAVDNLAAGTAIGGTRMSADVDTEVCCRLARAMTLKNAMAGLRHGGAKAGIIADPKMPLDQKEHIMRAFAAGIRELPEFIPGPDMGTDERCMAWIHDEIGRAIGLPAQLGGLPLDELGATGFGVSLAAETAADWIGLNLEGARVVIQGYGNVGRPAARFLSERGCAVIAAADSKGAILEPAGLDLELLDDIKRSSGSVGDYPAQQITHDEVVGVGCDIWIPAAGPDVLTTANVHRLEARIVIQGANIPATAEAERQLHERGIVNVPDFIANAGGVICGAVEYAKGSRTQAFTMIEEQIRNNTSTVLEASTKSGVAPRQVAMTMARERIDHAMSIRRWK